ncbi:MAG: tetratricopeptide repeat protein [Candidatus Tectomicrobia bacterium]|uniref:Tetratricopeptide repeat protein n=1 Tax=Tectimicrobiota bacterium TaxID=2528274 RepID=A0A932CQD0_UNCTE|nr:tetratricopeptide repeat protein [Candidatus Tectomicrobia bacterium]
MVRMVAVGVALFGLVCCGSPDAGAPREAREASQADRERVQAEILLGRQGRSALQKGQTLQAIRLFEAWVERYPRSPRREEISYLLADAYFRWAAKDLPRRFQPAIDAHQQALQLHPNSPQAVHARLQLAEIYWKSGLQYEALAAVEMVLEGAPPAPYPFKAKGKKAAYLLQMGRQREAWQIYEELLASPQPAEKPLEVSLGYADAAFSLGEFARALVGYQSVLKQFPDLPQSRPLVSYRLGEALFKNRRFKEAREVFESLQKKASKESFSHQLLARMGDCFLEEGDIQGAMLSYLRNLTRYPGTEGALTSKVRLADIGLRHKGLMIPPGETGYEAYLDPLAAYAEVARTRPDHPLAELALYKRAAALKNQKRYEEAEAGFRELLRRYPKSFLRNDTWFALRESLQQSIQQAYARGQWKRAIQIYRTNRESYLKGGMDRESLESLAGSYERLGWGERATEIYRELLDLYPPGSPEEERIRVGLGRTYFLVQEYASVLDFLREFPRRYPQSPSLGEVYRLLGDSLYHQKDCEGAREAYGQALRRGSPGALGKAVEGGAAAEIYVRMGDCYQSTGQGSKALEAYRKAVQAFPREKEAQHLPPHIQAGYLGLADGLYALGKYREACEIYATLNPILASDPRMAGALYRLADCYRRQGERKSAEAIWRSLAQRNGGGPWARLASHNLEEVTWQEAYGLERSIE